MDKLQRNYKLVVGTNSPLETFYKEGIKLVKSTSTITIEPPFTIDFDVTRNPYGAHVMGTIRIYNLKEDTRNRIHKVKYNPLIYTRCEFYAGYGTNLHPILVGDIGRCYSRREGVNYITTIEVYSGTYAHVNAKVSKVIPKGTSQKSMIEQFIQSLPEVEKPVIGNSLTREFADRSFAVNGKTVDLIKEYTDGNFFIDNEVPYVLSEGEMLNGIVNSIQSESGLIGSPQYEDLNITFTMVFEPRLLMFQVVNLESETERKFNGQYKVIYFRHYGMISEAVCGQVLTDVSCIAPEELRVVLGQFRDYR